MTSEPASIVPEVINWLGEGDADAAVKTVDPSLKSNTKKHGDDIDLGLEPEIVEIMDELYALIEKSGEFDKGFHRADE